MKSRTIVKEEKILSGEPVIAGTRIPVERLVYLLKHGYTEKNLRREFPGLSQETIRQVLFELGMAGLESLNHDKAKAE